MNWSTTGVRLVITGMLTSGQEALLRGLGFKKNTKVGNWTAVDEAIRRYRLNIPIDKNIVKDVPEVTSSFLADYQKEDIEKMLRMKNCINASEMGLGKTLETLVIMSLTNSFKVLIVCPKSIMYNWQAELFKWMKYPEEKISIVGGLSVKERQKELFRALTCDVVIINYASLRIPEVAKVLRKQKWDMMVIDEAHRIKGHKTKIFKTVRTFKAKRKIALTGTPIDNRPNDLWPILYWIDPFFSTRSYWRFVFEFCEVFDNGSGGIRILGRTNNTQRLEMLRAILKHVMIRRKLAETLTEIPKPLPATEISLHMTPEMQKTYEKVKEELLIELRGEESFISSGLVRMMRLLQFTSNPKLFKSSLPNLKFEALYDLLQGTEERFVIWTRFVDTANALCQFLEQKGITYRCVTGAIKDAKVRYELAEEFQNDSSIKCFIGTIKAVGEGLNLYQATKVVFIDREWAPGRNKQAIFRIYRKGQTKAIQVIDIRYQHTLDAYVEKVLDKKRDDIIAIIENL